MKRSSAATILAYAALFLLPACDTGEDYESDVSFSAKQNALLTGFETVAGEFPFMVQLRDKEAGNQLCGGVLIDKEWVLTAKQCVLYMDFEMVLGQYSRTVDESHEQVRQVATVIPFSQKHGPEGRDNDIALVKMDRPAYLNKWVQVIEISPDDPNPATVEDSYTALTMGWGITNYCLESHKDCIYSDRLLKLAFPVWPLQVCNDALVGTEKPLGDEKICAGDNNAMTIMRLTGPVAGDIGGPLVVRQADNSWSLIGIVSHQVGGLEKSLVGYMRVATYLPWINQQLYSNPPSLNLNNQSATDLFAYDRSTEAGEAHSVLFRQGGTVDEHVVLSSSFGNTTDIYPGDYNGDGISDLFLYDHSGRPGTGIAHLIFMDEDGDIKLGYPLSSAWRTTWTVHPGDYDGDGVTDLFLYDNTGIENARGVAHVFLFNQYGGIKRSRSLSTDWRLTWNVFPGDYNGDGVTDLFLYDVSGTENQRGVAVVALFDAAGNISTYRTLSTNWPKTMKVYPGDYNGDGTTDLFLYDNTGLEYSGGVARRMLFNSQGRIYSTRTLSTAWRRTWKIYPGDFDGNGTTDLFLYDDTGLKNQGGVAHLMLLNEQGLIDSSVPISTGWRKSWEIYPGDYNGVLGNDLLLYDPTGMEDQGGALQLVNIYGGRAYTLSLGTNWPLTWELNGNL